MNSKPIKRLIYVLLFFYLALHLYIATRPLSVLMNWFLTDDAFYYFQVARHVVNHHGFTFDGIGLCNGFHPLWMLINIPVFLLSKINLALPLRALVLLGAGLTFGGGLLLFDFLKAYLRIEIAFLGMVLWVFYWPLQRVITLGGMESGINAFSLILFLNMIARLDRAKKLNLFLMGLLGCLVLFSRLDNIFLVLLMGAWLVFDRYPIRTFLILDILTIFLSLFISVIIRTNPFDSLAFLPSTYLLLLAALSIKLLTFYFAKLYTSLKDLSLWTLMKRIGLAVIGSSTLLFIFAVVLMRIGLPSGFPRLALLIDMIVTFGLVMTSRLFLRNLVPDDQALLDGASLKRFAWRGLKYLLPIAVLFSVYIFWNINMFGTALPVSGQIKQWWGTLPNTTYGEPRSSILDVLGLFPTKNAYAHPWFLYYDLFFRPILLWVGQGKIEKSSGLMMINIGLFIVYSVGLGFLIRKKYAIFEEKIREIHLLPLFVAALLQPFFLASVGYLHTRS